MGFKFHIDGTQDFGYSTINRYLYSLYFYANTVNRICSIYNRNAPIDNIEGYAAQFCYIRLKSFDTYLKVIVEHKDYVTANCILRMLADSVAVFRLVYMEPNENLRLLRHCLYVLDGCEKSLEVLPEEKFNKGSILDVELEELDRQVKLNREHRMGMMREIQEMLDESPLKEIDKAAFDKIVQDKNWKFKEFKVYKNPKDNQYRWNELYDIIGKCKVFDLMSYISQYAHGLSMSNLNVKIDENVFDGLIGEGVGLLDIMTVYLLKFFSKDKRYIYAGLLEPDIRDRILTCYDEQHRPSIKVWESGVMRKMSECSI